MKEKLGDCRYQGKKQGKQKDQDALGKRNIVAK